MEEGQGLMTVEEQLDFVRTFLPEEERLCQLGEECGELAQAALKMRRVITGKNPTPVTSEAAEGALLEEAMDVILCLAALEVVDLGELRDEPRITEKLFRWVERLEEAKND